MILAGTTLSPSISVTHPMTELVGTGPFMLKSYAAEDRAIVVKNPLYWGQDAQGNQLPYFDEVDFIYSPDIAAAAKAFGLHARRVDSRVGIAPLWKNHLSTLGSVSSGAVSVARS